MGKVKVMLSGVDVVFRFKHDVIDNVVEIRRQQIEIVLTETFKLTHRQRRDIIANRWQERCGVRGSWKVLVRHDGVNKMRIGKIAFW